MPGAVFESVISVFERSKAVRASDCTVTDQYDRIVWLKRMNGESTRTAWAAKAKTANKMNFELYSVLNTETKAV